MCPLSLGMMRDPVFTRDGHCYERAVIENWFCTNDTSPITGTKLDDKIIVSAILIRKCIDEWKGIIVRHIPTFCQPLNWERNW